MLVQNRRTITPSVTPLLSAQIPADFADWLDYVAVGALLAFTWQVEPFVFAGLAVCLGLPYLLVGPFAGVIIDRSDLKTVLLCSNVGRALATATLALAWNWQSLLVIVFLRSCADAFFSPAKQSAILVLTNERNRLAVNGYSHAINQSSKIVAPALGGVLLLVFQPQQIFMLNALISISAALAVLLIRIPEKSRESIAKCLNFRGKLKSGWIEVAQKPQLKAALSLMAAGFFSMFFYDTLIAPLTRGLNFDETVFGLGLAAVGSGGVLGSLALRTKPKEVSQSLPSAHSSLALWS